MKILIVTTKWAAGTLENVHCSTHRALVRPAELLFENNPEIDLEIEYIEKNNIWSEQSLNQRLLKNDFDVCLVTPYKDIVPSLQTAKILGKKLFICVLDSLNHSTSNRAVNLRIFLKNAYDNGVVKFKNSMVEFSEFCNILVFDNGYDEILPNIYGVYEPIDTSVLYPIPEEEKEIELGFIGSMYEAERKWYVDSLIKHKFPLTILGGKGDNEQKLSYMDWAEANRHIKISLNFNGNYFLGARKGRVWEIAACKNLMIATLPEVYKYSKGKWFLEDVHYVAINERNYLEKIKFYLDNPDERIKIATNMHEHWKENYTAEKWWYNIFNWVKKLKNMFKDKNVLVTGGTGMIGRAVVDQLLNQGANITIADLSIPADKIKNVSYVKADLRYLDVCEDICQNKNYVFNIVGVKGSPQACLTQPADFMVPMLQFNTNMMEAARKSNVDWYLYTSSVGVYSPAEVFEEESVWTTFPSPNDRFAGWAKRMGELQAEAYAIQYDWKRYSIVRPANVYGKFDNYNPVNSMVIPSLIRKAQENEFLEVWGDGSSIRDFIYADDVASAMINCVQKQINEPLNLGSGHGYSIKEVVDLVIEASGKDLEVRWLTDKPNGDYKRIMSTEKAESYGIKSCTSLKDGIKNATDWFIANKASIDQKYNVFVNH